MGQHLLGAALWDVVAALGAVGAVLVAVVYGWPAFRREWAERQKTMSELRVEDWSWCVEQGIDAHELLRQLIGLDYASVPGLDHASEGHVEQWAPVFEASPETWRIVVFGQRMIAGYWSFFSLSPELQAKMLKGELFDSQIVSGAIRRVDGPGRHDVYVPMFAVHRGFQDRRQSIFRKLIGSFYDQVIALEARGVVFGTIHANAFTSEGASIARTLGFAYTASAQQGGEILGRSLDPDLKQKVRRLLKR